MDDEGKDTYEFSVRNEGELTIPTPRGVKVRVLDANGVEIPGRVGSWVVVITAEILKLGSYVTIEFYDGTPNENYITEVTFETIVRPQIPDNQTGNDNAPTQDAGKMLATGERLEAKHIVGVEIADEEGTNTAVTSPIDFAIVRNSDGTYTVDLDGRVHTFTAADREQFGFSYDEPDNADPHEQGVWLTYMSGSFDDLIDDGDSGDHYFLIFRVGKEIMEVRGSDPELETFAIVGRPSDNFNVMGGTTAIYDQGYAVLDFWPSDIPYTPGMNFHDIKERIESDNVTLTADFSTMQISGRIYDFVSKNGPVSNAGLNMPWTDFDINGFHGNFEVKGLDPDETAELAFDGSFFGPNVDDVAGTISGTYKEEESHPESPVIGWFFAER